MALNIGILGTRGIPNHYGGFEHIAGHLARGLVKRGHGVTVYNSSRHPYQSDEWHGVHIVHCYDPEHLIGMAGQFVYDLNCLLDARKKKYDILLMLGYTSSSVWGFLYPPKTVIITNMDGMEWQRTKYSGPVRHFLHMAERWAVRASNFHIADSPIMRDYLDDTYHIRSHYIAYGAEPQSAPGPEGLATWGLRAQNYFLLMARMEPENNIEMVLDGFAATSSILKFAVIGNTGNRMGKRLRHKYRHDSRIVFLGAIFEEEEVHRLTYHCRLYFHGHSVGGTNPSLLDAMGARVPIAAHSNLFNRSLLQDNARFFDSPQTVSQIIGQDYNSQRHMSNNHNRILDEFTWPMITDQYEKYFLDCYSASRSGYSLRESKALYSRKYEKAG